MNTTGPNTATTAVRSHDTSGIPQNASHRPPVPDYASTDSSSGDEADDDDSEAEDFGTKSQTAHSTRQHKIYRQWHDHETGLLRNALRIHARNQAPRSTRTCHSCSKSLAAPGAKWFAASPVDQHSCGAGSAVWSSTQVASLCCTGINHNIPNLDTKSGTRRRVPIQHACPKAHVIATYGRLMHSQTRTYAHTCVCHMCTRLPRVHLVRNRVCA